MWTQEQIALINTIKHRKGTFGGKPVIGETRWSVETVLYNLAHGMSAEELLVEFAPITFDDIRACLLYAATKVKSQEWPHMSEVLETKATGLNSNADVEKHLSLTQNYVRSCLLYAAQHVK